MEQADYSLAWTFYIVTGLLFMVLVWWFSRRHLQRDLAFFIQGVFAALIFTPWYVFPDQDYLAPALMVFMMDSITISAAEGVRGLIPLVMALLLAIIVTIVRSVLARVLDRRRQALASEDAGQE